MELEFEVLTTPTKDQAEEMAAFGFRPIYTTTSAQSCVGFSERMLEARSNYRLKLEELHRDVNLSATGKANRKRQLAAEAIAELERHRTFGGERKGYEQRLAAKRERAALTKLDKLDAVGAIRQTWIWEKLAAIDPVERPYYFQRAVEEGDEEMFRAFTSIPKLFALLEPETIAAGETAWAERANPEAAREVAELSDAMIRTEGIYRNVRAELAKEAGPAEADPLTKAAAEGDSAGVVAAAAASQV